MAKRVVISEKPDETVPVNMQRLGQFIRFRRTSMSMTIESAAAICGISKQAFSNAESGLESTRAKTIFKVLDCLGITLWFDNRAGANDTGHNDEWF